MPEQIMKTEDFNQVAIALDRLKALGVAIAAISEQIEDDALRTLGFLIEDITDGADRLMNPPVAAQGGE